MSLADNLDEPLIVVEIGEALSDMSPGKTPGLGGFLVISRLLWQIATCPAAPGVSRRTLALAEGDRNWELRWCLSRGILSAETARPIAGTSAAPGECICCHCWGVGAVPLGRIILRHPGVTYPGAGDWLVDAKARGRASGSFAAVVRRISSIHQAMA
ncbi:hypothetical protein NDU88_004854 [Pleurodeles waltl]|uniref:Uncharacterized protein n=1 Tax=Pleurodeles waltl TaxID=8319 RepID=A0AAV7PDP0_PLEWA|nr:hypothetical protein NDU88_004854 [Pleurodeles waltl]